MTVPTSTETAIFRGGEKHVRRPHARDVTRRDESYFDGGGHVSGRPNVPNVAVQTVPTSSPKQSRRRWQNVPNVVVKTPSTSSLKRRKVPSKVVKCLRKS